MGRLKWIGVLMLLASLTIRARAADPLPTVEQIHKEFDAAKYHDVLKSLTRLMSSRDWQVTTVGHYDLLMLKAQVHLRLKQPALAVSSFALAAKEARDPKSAAVAHASELLLKRCNGLHFSPKPPPADHSGNSRRPEPPAPIDIVDPESRKQAMTVFYQEEKSAAQWRINLAEKGTAVQPVLDVGPTLSHLRELDIGANGSDDETLQAASTIAEHGRDLLSAMTEKMGIRCDLVCGKVMAWDHSKSRGVDIWRRHGWDGNEESELKEMLAKSDKILAAAQIMRQSLLAEKGFFTPVIKEAKRIHDKADKTIHADLGETTTTRPKDMAN
ncbi:MAG TPA: hypothetical protein VFC78_04525 [Tepidisphaeraceae bacterium]|nr:hypothetical protein [Tepidisphaeraceae bacterium]